MKPTIFIATLSVAQILTAADYYVSTTGTDASTNGSSAQPLRTIQYTINNKPLTAGDRIIIRSGTYPELVTWPGSPSTKKGTSANPIIVQAESPGTVTIIGSDVVTGWTSTVRSDGVRLWRRSNWAVNSQQVIWNGQLLTQAGSPGYTVQHTNYNYDQNSMPRGFFYQSGTDLWVTLPTNTDSPEGTARASVRKHLVTMGTRSSGDGSWVTFRGITFKHCNSTLDGNQLYGIVLASGSRLENCVVEECDYSGVAMGYQQEGTQVIDSSIRRNGACGIDAYQSKGFLVRNCVVENNKYRPYASDHHAGGMKFLEAYGTVEHNEVRNNNGPGIWFDTCNTGTAAFIRNNFVYGNHYASIFFEVSGNGRIYSNVVRDSPGEGILISASSDTYVYNNTIAFTNGYAALDVGKMPRTVPAHNLTGNIVRNNIIYGSSANTYDVAIYKDNANSTTGYLIGNNVLNQNVYYRSSGSYRFALLSVGAPTQEFGTLSQFTQNSSGQAWETQGTVANPLFASTRRDYFALSANSPAINSGFTTSSTGPLDYVNVVQPKGGAFDRGAYESTGQSHVGLVGLWRFDTGHEGTAYEDMNGFNGSLIDTSWAAGKTGYGSLSFNGSSSRVSIANATALNPSSAITICGWFKRTSGGIGNHVGVEKPQSYRLVATPAVNGNYGWQFGFQTPDGVYGAVTSPANYSHDTWYHVCGTYDGATMRLYVNGVAAATGVARTGSIKSSTETLEFGRGRQYDNTGAFFKGQMDHIKIFSGALTQAQAKTEHDATAQP